MNLDISVEERAVTDVCYAYVSPQITSSDNAVLE